MKIEITEQDIKNGNPCDSQECAVSQALKRTFKVDEAYTEVDGGDITLTVNEKKYGVGYKYESDVLDFIFDFDQVDGWSNVKPITFKIEELKNE